jgi:hypothetical protein
MMSEMPLRPDLTRHGSGLAVCHCECEPEGRPGMYQCIHCKRIHPESVLELKSGKWVMRRFEGMGKQRKRR